MDFSLNEEQNMIQETARKFSRNELAPKAGEIDENQEFPRNAWEKLSELGFAGLTVPEVYGGSGMDYVTAAIVMEELAGGCMATSGTYSVHLTVEYLLSNFGSTNQKESILPAMAQGKQIGALAITEPNAGSDAASMLTTAVVGGQGYSINGTKIFITTGGEADIYVVYAKTDPKAGHRGFPPS